MQNIIDITATARQLKTEGYDITKEDFDITIPYLTGHIMRFDVYYDGVNKPSSKNGRLIGVLGPYSDLHLGAVGFLLYS